MISTTLTLIIPMIVSGLPENADFEIQYFNTSNCSAPIRSSTIKSLCLNTNKNRGYPKCCYDLLEKVSFERESTFDTCYRLSTPNTTVSGVTYDCRLSKYNGMTLEEGFGLFGLVSLVVLIVILAMCIGFKCLCRRRGGYDSV
jgi:hypothetical protein